MVFQDETGFTLHPRLGFGWARRGQRLRVPTTSQHCTRLNVSGWVAPLLGRYGMIRTERGNREGFLDLLRDLYRRLRGLQITLYVDGAGWHKGVPVRDFLRTHPRLRLQYLPAYQPALNRQERIWSSRSLRGNHQLLVRHARRHLGYRAANNRGLDTSETSPTL